MDVALATWQPFIGEEILTLGLVCRIGTNRRET